jgi:ubiquinone/menaquinone biosynthesis C-methylase UbiE
VCFNALAMDETGHYVQRRWKALGKVGALFTRPWLDLDAAAARQRLDPDGVLGEIRSKEVLCVAGGGGQQSVAFGVLGAAVAVLDFDAGQLERDRDAATHHGLSVRTELGDMRDLSRFPDRSFDIVWHPYSVNFVEEFGLVVNEAARVLRPDGLYMLMMANPFASGIGTKDWNGAGFVLQRPYVDGAKYEFEDEAWVGASSHVPPPREYRHTLGKAIESLSRAGLCLFRVDDVVASRRKHVAGSWEHLQSIIPPWLTLWARPKR